MKVVHKQGAVHICEQCGRQFRNTSAGRKHSKNCTSKNRRAFSGGRPKGWSNSATACRFCSKSYTTLIALKDHYIKQHKPCELELLCMKCNVLLNSQDSLAEHKQKAHENLRCTVCKKDCLTETSLAIHMAGHANGKQRFECKVSQWQGIVDHLMLWVFVLVSRFVVALMLAPNTLKCIIVVYIRQSVRLNAQSRAVVCHSRTSLTYSYTRDVVTLLKQTGRMHVMSAENDSLLLRFYAAI